MERGSASGDGTARATDGGVDADTAQADQSGGGGIADDDRPGRQCGRSVDTTSQAIVVGVGIGVGVLSYLMVSMWADGLSTLVASLVGEPGTVLSRTVETVGLGLGMLTGAAAYLVVFDRGIDYLDLRRPSRRAVGYALAAALVSFVTALTVTALVEWLDITAQRHSASQEGQRVPSLFPVLIVLSFVIIGPAEELVYRNVVQKSVAEAVSAPVAIGVATVVYVFAHVPSLLLGGGTVASVLPAVVVLTVLSVALGVSYARTETLVVPAFAHGLYDALLFGTDYLSVVGVF